MTTATQKILAQASLLQPTERAELIEALMDSFRLQPPTSADAWRSEAENRVAALNAGELETESVDDLMTRINSQKSC